MPLTESSQLLGPHLPPTERQVEALRAYVHHGTHAAAAEALGVTQRTFKSHLAALRQRLWVHNTAQAVYVLWLGYRDHLTNCPERGHGACMRDIAEIAQQAASVPR